MIMTITPQGAAAAGLYRCRAASQRVPCCASGRPARLLCVATAEAQVPPGVVHAARRWRRRAAASVALACRRGGQALLVKGQANHHRLRRTMRHRR